MEKSHLEIHEIRIRGSSDTNVETSFQMSVIRLFGAFSYWSVCVIMQGSKGLLNLGDARESGKGYKFFKWFEITNLTLRKIKLLPIYCWAACSHWFTCAFSGFRWTLMWGHSSEKWTESGPVWKDNDPKHSHQRSYERINGCLSSPTQSLTLPKHPDLNGPNRLELGDMRDIMTPHIVGSLRLETMSFGMQGAMNTVSE